MPKLLVENLSDRVIELGIEPWADLEVMAPDARVIFEYVEPAEIEFAILPDDKAGVPTVAVSIISDHIKVRANGREKIFRPPPGDWSSI